MHVNDLLKKAVDNGASDLHLKVGSVPMMRVRGTLMYGMQTFDQSIFGLFQEGLVAYEEAPRWASHVDEFKLRVQDISTTGDISRDQMLMTVAGRGTPVITRFGG